MSRLSLRRPHSLPTGAAEVGFSNITLGGSHGPWLGVSAQNAFAARRLTRYRVMSRHGGRLRADRNSSGSRKSTKLAGAAVCSISGRWVEREPEPWL